MIRSTHCDDLLKPPIMSLLMRKRKPVEDIKRDATLKRNKVDLQLRQDAIVLMNGMPWIPDLFNFECARRHCGSMMNDVSRHLWSRDIDDILYAQQMALVKHILLCACDQDVCDENIIRIALTVAPSSFVLINSIPVATSPSQYNQLFLHNRTRCPVTKFTVLYPHKTILIDVVFAQR
jgi:hypothetical protein